MPECEQDRPQRPRHTVTLGNSQWSAVNYSVVEFLRIHRVCRGMVATLGVVLAVVLVSTFMGLRIPRVTLSYAPLFFVAPWLLWVATVSGNEFQLVFPALQASKERQGAEKQFEASNSPEDALKLDLKRLNEYYVINQGQARSSFRWAVFSMFVGFGTIIAGIWLFYFRTSQPDKFMASLSTAAGSVVNLVSGLFLYLHSKTQDRSLHYYQQLARLQKLSIAIRLVEGHWDPAEQTQARSLVIRALLSEGKLTETATDV